MESPTVRIGISSSLRPGKQPTPEQEVSLHMMQAVERAGAAPVPLAVGRESIEKVYGGEVSGLILSGGTDIEPQLHGGRAERCYVERDSERDHTEIALLIAAITLRLPLLCVCRGMQLTNAVMGGTLIEDLPSEFGSQYVVKHHQTRELNRPRHEYAHGVTVAAETKLARIVEASRFDVNSTHHQAVRDLAPGLVAVAHSDDGVIEAIESKESWPFFIGVQWHPETLPRNDNVSLSLFGALVEAAIVRREK